MSRGPGIRQRVLLDLLTLEGRLDVRALARVNRPRADGREYREAAMRLARAGRVAWIYTVECWHCGRVTGVGPVANPVEVLGRGAGLRGLYLRCTCGKYATRYRREWLVPAGWARASDDGVAP